MITCHHTWAWGGLGGLAPQARNLTCVGGGLFPPDRHLIACRYRQLVPPPKVAHAHVWLSLEEYENRTVIWCYDNAALQFWFRTLEWQLIINGLRNTVILWSVRKPAFWWDLPILHQISWCPWFRAPIHNDMNSLRRWKGFCGRAQVFYNQFEIKHTVQTMFITFYCLILFISKTLRWRV